MIQPLHMEELFRTLLQHRVEFLVIGGAAVAVHGYPRATRDLDIVPDPALANIERLHTALVELQAEPTDVSDFRPDEFPELSVANLSTGGSWCLATTQGRLDVLQFVEGILETPGDYAKLADNAIEVETAAGRLRIVGLEDLIAFKHVAGRDQDLIDIRALREAHDDTGP